MSGKEFGLDFARASAESTTVMNKNKNIGYVNFDRNAAGLLPYAVSSAYGAWARRELLLPGHR